MLLSIMLLFLCSCATPDIKLDPSATDYRSNYSKVVGMENLTIVARIVKVKKVAEGKEFIKVPEFIPEFSKISLTSDTVAVYVGIKIINEKKVGYKIYEKYTMKRNVSDFPYLLSHKLYEGSLSFNEFQVYIPSLQDIEKMDISFELRDDKDQIRDVFGNFSVLKTEWEKGGNRFDNWGGDPRGK
jgi:hypothetical protein